MADTDATQPEWVDGHDTYGYPRWWALEPGESEVLETLEFLDVEATKLDYNNRPRPYKGVQIRVRVSHIEPGLTLGDVFIQREFVGTSDYNDNPRQLVDTVVLDANAEPLSQELPPIWWVDLASLPLAEGQ